MWSLNKNLATANRSRVSCTHNMSRASIGRNITAFNKLKWCHCWRKQDSTVHHRVTTGPSPTSRLSPRYWSDSCWHAHLLGSANFSEYQSAYRKGHSTETALLEVLDGVYTAADNKQVTLLIGLDLSAAFDTVDHEILLQRLQSEFGVTIAILDPFASGRQDPVRQTGPASVTGRWAWRRRP